MKLISVMATLVLSFSLMACSPKVGTPEWCKMIKEKSAGDITPNEAADYATECLFK